MIIDFWMILLFLVVFGVWAEWRNYSGRKEGFAAGFNYSSNTDQTTRDFIKKEEGILFLLNLMKDKGLIIIDEDGTITGYNNTKLNVEKYVQELMKGK